MLALAGIPLTSHEMIRLMFFFFNQATPRMYETGGFHNFTFKIDESVTRLFQVRAR